MSVPDGGRDEGGIPSPDGGDEQGWFKASNDGVRSFLRSLRSSNCCCRCSWRAFCHISRQRSLQTALRNASMGLT